MMRFTLTTLLLFSVLFLGGCFRYGQALLRFEVTRDGEPVLESYRGVWDETPVDQMWDELDTLVFEPIPDRPTSPIAGPDAKRVELTGDVSISIWHVTRLRDKVALSSLALERRDEYQKWKLAEGEAKRVREEAQAD